jgi:hypothetical protein
MTPTRKRTRKPTIDEVGLALRDLIEQLDVRHEYKLEGGGLRHGDSAWEVVYDREGLTRNIFLTAHDDPVSDEVVVYSQVAATDGMGGWRHISRPSPHLGSVTELNEVLLGVLSDGISKADSIQPGELSGQPPG